MLKSTEARYSVLGTAVTMATAGVGLLLLPKWQIVGGALLSVAALLTLAVYVNREHSRAPRVPRGFRLTSHTQHPFPDKRWPYAADARITPRRPVLSPRFEVICDQTPFSAAAVVELLDSGQLLGSWALRTKLQGESVFFEFADPILSPPAYLMVEVRSPHSIRIQRIKCRRGSADPQVRGFNIVSGLTGQPSTRGGAPNSAPERAG
jgi:hypothetical protein